MSDRLLPRTHVRQEIPVKRIREPSIGPQLLWPSIRYGQGIESHDAPHFPDPENVRDRRREIESGTERGLCAFEDAVAESVWHVLVLDQHFDAQGADILGEALSLSQVRDVRLLTGPRVVCKASRVITAPLMSTSSRRALRASDLILSICCLNAYRNGAGPEIMEDVFVRNRGRIGTIIGQFERWQELERDVRKRPDIVSQISELKAEIDQLNQH